MRERDKTIILYNEEGSCQRHRSSEIIKITKGNENEFLSNWSSSTIFDLNIRRILNRCLKWISISSLCSFRRRCRSTVLFILACFSLMISWCLQGKKGNRKFIFYYTWERFRRGLSMLEWFRVACKLYEKLRVVDL